MIYYNIVRQFCTIQLKTSLKAKLVKRMLDQNSQSFIVFKKLTEIPEIKQLSNIFTSAGYELRIAGGAVRDLLCGIQPNDLDFASNATPKQMINIMRDKDNIRLITTPSGERHGTVTARINDKHQYEITTLRVDKVTDGRHAEVEFVNDWKLDASRRDLTINSMFLGLDGVLFDYFDGQTDLKNKHIRFVGEPEARVKEDYLRIFRYFRFHARFGCADKHDSQTLMTFKNNCEGLTRISGERIWSEIKRILIIKHCEDVIKVMFNDIGLGKYMGFKKNLNIINPNQNQNISEYFIDLSEFHEVLSRLTNAVDNRLIECWEPITLFSSLICDIEEFISVSARLKLSNIEKETAIYIITNRSKFTNDLKAFQNQLALTHKPNQNHMRKFIIEFMKYSGLFSHIEIINNWKIPEFPFTGHLIGGRVKRRSHISSILNELKLIWVESNFQLTEEELKIKLDQILEQEIYKK